MLKKYIALPLALAAVLSLAACDASSNVPTTGQTGETLQTTVPTETVTVEPSMGVGERGDYEDDMSPTVSATEPEATQPQSTEPEATQPQSTEPEETVPSETKPEETEPEVTEPGTAPDAQNPQTTLTYSEYMNMTGEEQEAFVESFPALRDFVDWWNAAKAAEKGNDDVITGDPNIDLGDLIP